MRRSEVFCKTPFAHQAVLKHVEPLRGRWSELRARMDGIHLGSRSGTVLSSQVLPVLLENFNPKLKQFGILTSTSMAAAG